MMTAHEESLKAYERMIAFAEDEGNSLDEVKAKFDAFMDVRCRYCAVDNYNCSRCVLGTRKNLQRNRPCLEGHMADSRKGMRYIYFIPNTFSHSHSRKQITLALQTRLDALVLQAEFNMSDGDYDE